METVEIGGSPVGDGHPALVIVESGINHQGDVNVLRRMVDESVGLGANAIKTQTRTVDVVYSPAELAKPRESVFGSTNGDLKRGLELSKEEYDEFDTYCKIRDFAWLSSPWDIGAADFLSEYDIPAYKVASACLTDDKLLTHLRLFGKPIILSTGMSTWAQIDHAVDILGRWNLVLLHCTSVYPARSEHLNLNAIPAMKKRYGIPVGYSSHETGLATTVASVAIGANMIERHMTLDRSSWGSDQSSSTEPQGMARIVRDVREIEKAMGDGVKRIHPDELGPMKKLRRIDTARLAD